MATDRFTILEDRVTELEAQITALIELVTNLSMQIHVCEARIDALRQ